MTAIHDIKKYLALDTQTMQLATVSKDRPWICTVWFVVDDEMNLYWLSLPSRRHSRDIANNPKVAAAIAVNTEMPTIGLQFEGVAEQVNDPEIVKSIMEKYVAKYGEGKFFYDRLLAGKNQHVLYRLKPYTIKLHDSAKVPEDSTIKLNAI